ncbi:hypothetical protein C3B55_00773 [Candidatus Pseudomonas adelgestsugas]|uniref:Uncharacterized protein n=1 Tax=Candidatus Pseudomonas adelgestsugas TaxID=1302376 RepID=A0ABX5R8X0_9PSED|nr:hypothetical protein C3B55_00773 [Candidatus Pseudomonas adelgestsugas]
MQCLAKQYYSVIKCDQFTPPLIQGLYLDVLVAIVIFDSARVNFVVCYPVHDMSCYALDSFILAICILPYQDANQYNS